MAKITEAFVEITAKLDKLKSGLSKAVALTKGAAGMMAAAIGKMASGIVSVVQSAFSFVFRWIKRITLAVTALASVIAYKSIKAWQQQEAATVRLATALKLAGDSSASGLADMIRFSAEVQKLSTFGDEAVQSFTALAASITGKTGQELQNIVLAGLGLSRAFDMDPRTGVELFARAVKGQTQTLTRYGIVLDQTLDAQGQLNQLFKMATAGLQFETAALETQAGKWSRVKALFGDVAEQIGRILTDGKDGVSLLDRLRDALEQLVNYLKEIPPIGDRIKRIFSKEFFEQMKNHIRELFDLIRDELNNLPLQAEIIRKQIAKDTREILEAGPGTLFGLLKRDPKKQQIQETFDQELQRLKDELQFLRSQQAKARQRADNERARRDRSERLDAFVLSRFFPGTRATGSLGGLVSGGVTSLGGLVSGGVTTAAGVEEASETKMVAKEIARGIAVAVQTATGSFRVGGAKKSETLLTQIERWNRDAVDELRDISQRLSTSGGFLQ